MKKILMMIVALCMMAPATIEAATPLEKAQKKEMKAKVKEYNKEGYKMLGSRSMEVALLKHYEKLNTLGDNAQEVWGMSKAKSKNMAQQMAVNNACIDYASKAGRTLAGRIAVDMGGDNTNVTDAEFDHFYAAYESSIEKEIRGEMEHSYSVIKENSDGTVEIISYFIINEDAASKARIRAFENASKESEAAQKNAEKISEFVRGRIEE